MTGTTGGNRPDGPSGNGKMAPPPAPPVPSQQYSILQLTSFSFAFSSTPSTFGETFAFAFRSRQRFFTNDDEPATGLLQLLHIFPYFFRRQNLKYLIAIHFGHIVRYGGCSIALASRGLTFG
uniref:Uncharacterized protein n=1 Tax=Romanomermis culicivorax TaxID=13658 RepID=A0A915L288_ROMCU